MNFYGHVRATNDMDLVVQIAPVIAKKLYELFQHDFYIDLAAVQEAIQRRSMFNIIDHATIFKADLIIAPDDALTEQQFARRRCFTIGERSLYVISPEDLILAKLEWSRESESTMQENDITNLLRTMRESLDMNYLRQWATKRRLLVRLERLYAQK